MKYLIIIVFFLFGQLSLLRAQNPFEIVDRLGAATTATTVDTATTAAAEPTIAAAADDTSTEEPTAALSTVSIDSDNPFEIVARGENESFAPSVSDVVEPEVKEKSEITPSAEIEESASSTPKRDIPEDGTSNFILLLLTLIPTTILFTVFRSYLGKVVENFGQSGVLTRSYREYAGASIVPMNSWFVLFFINLGLFVALVLKHYGRLLADNLLWHVGICILGVSIFILVKRAFLAFLGLLFPIQKQIGLYLYLLMVFSILVGVFLTLANISLLYIMDEGFKPLIYSSFAILLILYLIRTYRGLLIVNRLALLHTFHFLLYICTVEIAPIFVLTKLVMLYGK